MFRGSSIVAVFVLSTASACSSGGPTTIGGDVAVHLNASTTNTLTFPEGTTLPLDRAGANSGLVVGHCALTGEATEISLTRSPEGSTPASGFVFFQVNVDSPDAPHVGHVMAQIGSDVYEADCDFASFERERSHGVVDLELSGCTLLTPSPSGVNSVTVDAGLSLDACSVQ